MVTKTVLITGASSGIGQAFAEELATRDTHLILVARSQDKLYRLAKQLQEKTSSDVEVIVQDLTESQAGQKVYDWVEDKGLAVDLLINNAGFGDYGPFAERDLSRQLEMIQLNVTVLVELTHLFLSPMQQRGEGSIINVASIAGFQALPYLSTYAATKAFVLSFTEALWAENKDKGINFLALCPGPTESNFFEAAQFPQSFENKNNGSLTSAETVVKDALNALDNCKSNVVTGGMTNNLIVNASRFFPREFLLSAVEKQFSPK
ncbi:SDR family NAD(P)-dependent oxidoreductase [Crocosphaera sp.]|uniref:SDR family NAD(P)-dependent oxidoreductase n=1 Tax=Crocosphaera sp. TaxID=2729996 RepID=UPI003F218813|nr:SDR family oxidoreductase [Crocosphaera sp.]